MRKRLLEDKKLSRLCSEAGLRWGEIGQFFSTLPSPGEEGKHFLCRKYTLLRDQEGIMMNVHLCFIYAFSNSLIATVCLVSFKLHWHKKVQSGNHQLLFVFPQIQFLDRVVDARVVMVCHRRCSWWVSVVCESIGSSSFSLDAYSINLCYPLCLLRDSKLICTVFFSHIPICASSCIDSSGCCHQRLGVRADQNTVSTQLPPSDTEQSARSRATARALWNWSERQLSTLGNERLAAVVCFRAPDKNVHFNPRRPAGRNTRASVQCRWSCWTKVSNDGTWCSGLIVKGCGGRICRKEKPEDIFITIGRDLDTTLSASFRVCILFAIVEQLNSWVRVFPALDFIVQTHSVSSAFLCVVEDYEAMIEMMIECRSCGEKEFVRQVHTLFGRTPQVVYELQMQELFTNCAVTSNICFNVRSHEHSHIIECSSLDSATFDIRFCLFRTWSLTLFTNSAASLSMTKFSE